VLLCCQRVLPVTRSVPHTVGLGVGVLQDVEEVAFPLLEALVGDVEVVIRQHVAEQIRGLAAVCAATKTDKGYRLLIEQLLHHLNKLVSDEEAVVRALSLCPVRRREPSFFMATSRRCLAPVWPLVSPGSNRRR
jgi:hypothetical protein